MTILTRSDIHRMTVSALGALLVSTACIGAAVWPAKAAEVTTVSTASAWQAEVERRIDDEMITPAMGWKDAAMAEVIMRFDERGNFRTATLGKTSGISDIDQEAIRIAHAISYPVLPTHLQGKPQRVAMQLFFGNNDAKVTRQRLKASQTATALAAKADANRAEARIATQPAG